MGYRMIGIKTIPKYAVQSVVEKLIRVNAINPLNSDIAYHYSWIEFFCASLHVSSNTKWLCNFLLFIIMRSALSDGVAIANNMTMVEYIELNWKKPLFDWTSRWSDRSKCGHCLLGQPIIYQWSLLSRGWFSLFLSCHQCVRFFLSCC